MRRVALRLAPLVRLAPWLVPVGAAVMIGFIGTSVPMSFVGAVLTACGIGAVLDRLARRLRERGTRRCTRTRSPRPD
jgi:hypothetical protein